MAILKYRSADGSMTPVGLPPGIVDWKNIINKPMLLGNSELSTDVDVITLSPGAKASAQLLLNKDTNQFELTLFIPRGADGAGGVGDGNEGGTTSVGVSPTIKVTEIEGGYNITIVDVSGVPQSVNLFNAKSAYELAVAKGYKGEEDDFYTILGQLGTLNYILATDVTEKIDTEVADKIPNSGAVVSYISDFLAKEYIVLTAVPSMTETENNDNPADEIEPVLENDAGSVQLALDEANIALFEFALANNKPFFLFVLGANYVLYYMGKHTFWGNIENTFITAQFDSNYKAELVFTNYLTPQSLTNIIDKNNYGQIPTAKGVVDYVKTQVTDTVNEVVSLPISSKALIEYLKDNSNITVLTPSFETVEGYSTILLNTADKKAFLANMTTYQPMYLYLAERDLCLTYVGNSNFIGFAGGQFLTVDFETTPIDPPPEATGDDELPPELLVTIKGTLKTSTYISSSIVTNSFCDTDSNSTQIPNVQAVLSYLSNQTTNTVETDSLLWPTSGAVVDYIKDNEQFLVLLAEKTEVTDTETLATYLTLSESEFEKLSTEQNIGKTIVLRTDDNSMILFGVQDSTFIGLFNNDIVSVTFSRESLTARLNPLKVLSQKDIATAVESADDSIPTLKILKDFFDAYGDITIPNATQTSDGLLSQQDKLKLDGIAANANKYEHPLTHPIEMIEYLPERLTAISNQITSTGISINTINENKLDKNLVGVPKGVASLDEDGKVPKELLPEVFTDGIEEGYYNNSDGVFYSDSEFTIAIEPIKGNYYVDKNTRENYRYSGSMYISQSSDALENIRELNADELEEIINCRI